MKKTQKSTIAGSSLRFPSNLTNSPETAENTLKNDFDIPKKLIHIRTPYNALPNIRHYEINDEPSETIPGQSYSALQLLDRMSKNLPLTGGREPLFFGEDFTHPQPEHMELTDRMEALQHQRELVNELNQKIAAEKDSIKKSQRQKQIDDAVKLEIEKINKTQSSATEP